ncbi:hypothetical protein AQUCO_00300356v1 [Aquilegia coerulea]|uniref:Helitron helicase-like domain-containing protein n=1 Tax=Aquilegia coerulea TaxID=218851 RepID=A0A2G5EYI3_AQUCA|nr:hypothetical protein AQUCO_00300356v1 [Aquilegia coerulea]
MNTRKENSSNNGCSGVRITVEQKTITEDNIVSLSKAQIAQRRRREKERAKQNNNETPTKSVARETSAGNNIVLLSNYQIAQRKQRENERSGQNIPLSNITQCDKEDVLPTVSNNNDGTLPEIIKTEILLSNKRQRINKDVPPTNPTILRATNQEEISLSTVTHCGKEDVPLTVSNNNDATLPEIIETEQCMQEENLEGLSRQQTSQRKRRERENVLLGIPKNKTQRRIKNGMQNGIVDGGSQAVEDVVDGGSQAGNQLLEETKGKQPIVEVITYFYGSSSTGDSSREYNVIKRCPMKERTNMEENDSTTNVHPVSDSHYDTILEDEIHIPIDQVENIPKERHYLGKMDVICPSCSAYHWLDERLTKSTKKKSFFGMCCLQGKIKLPLLTPLPSAIKLLYEGRNSLARSFRKDIRSYNAANAFSSLGVSMDKRILKGRGPTSFTIHGQLSNQIGSLLPESDKSPSYSQLYIYDPHIALDCRQKRNLHLNPAILKIIQETLLESRFIDRINHFIVLEKSSKKLYI